MTTAWIVMAIIGGALLLVTFVADTFEVDVPGTDAGLPAEAIAGFLAAAGLIGALLTSSGVAIAVTVPVALGAGTGMGAAALALVRVLMHTPTDATPSREDFIGAIAKVITPISADGVGEVLLTRHGQPWKVTAQLVEGEGPLPAGTSVIVVDTLSATRVVVTASTL